MKVRDSFPMQRKEEPKSPGVGRPLNPHLAGCHILEYGEDLRLQEIDKNDACKACERTVSLVSRQVAWNTTPKEPLPTTRSVA